MTTWYIRTSGSSNGGTSPSVRSSGSDGVTNGTNTLTSASALFVPGDVGHGISINFGGATRYRLITAYNSPTSIVFSGAVLASGSARTWVIGGAMGSSGAGATGFKTLFDTNAGLNEIPPMTSGDQVWVGGGTYRSNATTHIDQTNAGAGFSSNVTVSGDTDGSHTGDPGEVILTTYPSGDKTAPTGSSQTISFVNNDNIPARFWVWENMTLIGADVLIDSTNTLSYIADSTFRNLVLWNQFGTSQSKGFHLGRPPFGTPHNIVIEKCRIFTHGYAVDIVVPNSASGSDYDTNIAIRNCLILSPGASFGNPIYIGGTVNTKKVGGIKVDNCTIITSKAAIYLDPGSNSLSTTTPSYVRNCHLFGGGISAVTLGQFIEDYNVINAGSNTALTNVTAGSNSKSDGSYMSRIHFGDEISFGANPRPFGMPVDGSPLLGFGSDASVVLTDDLNSGPRPSGSIATKAIGAMERSNGFVRETGTVYFGSVGLSCTGPDYQDFDLPVAQATTKVRVHVRWDATYAGTKPQMKIIKGTECGVADITATAAGSSGAWETLEIIFTPTSAGRVTVRLQSNDTNGTGKMYADLPVAG